MKITVKANEQEFDSAAAWRVIGQILDKPDSVIGLSTGRTTGNMHRIIAEIHCRAPFDVTGTTFFGLDEVVNVPREYYGACYTMLKTELIDFLGVDEEHFLMLPVMSDDFDDACAAFVSELHRRGGIDLLILGLGENGHLGFNQPGSPFGKEAWVTDMNHELEARISLETGIKEGLRGVTLGIKAIMNARRIVLVAKGANKAQIVKTMFECPVTPDIPASVLRLHPDVEFLFDADAASLINPQNIH